MKSSFPHQDSLSLRAGLVRGLATALVAAGCLAGCDTPEDPSDRALELDDLDDLDDLTDEELDDLIAEQDGEDAPLEEDAARDLAPVETIETVADVLAELPEALQLELSSDELDHPIEIEALQMAVDVDHNGVLDGMDDLVSISDPVQIGEMACATNALTDPTDGATVAMGSTPGCGYAYNGSTSPNTSYDAPGCPHQYVTEVTGTYNRALDFYWDWHGANLDQSLCEMSHANLTAYGARFTWPFGISWTKLGTSAVHGVWYSGLFNFCGWAYDTGSGAVPSLGASHTYYKVRTATQATGFIFKQRVEGGVGHGPGPC